MSGCPMGKNQISSRGERGGWVDITKMSENVTRLIIYAPLCLLSSCWASPSAAFSREINSTLLKWSLLDLSYEHWAPMPATLQFVSLCHPRYFLGKENLTNRIKKHSLCPGNLDLKLRLLQLLSASKVCFLVQKELFFVLVKLVL